MELLSKSDDSVAQVDPTEIHSPPFGTGQAQNTESQSQT